MTSLTQIETQSAYELIQSELTKDRAFHPNLGGRTRGGLANHFPMTILSLKGLGASAAEVQNFMDHWPRFRARSREDLGLQDHLALNADNWTQYLGQPDKLLAFQRVFTELLNAADDPIERLPELLNPMLRSLPMGFFSSDYSYQFCRFRWRDWLAS